MKTGFDSTDAIEDAEGHVGRKGGHASGLEDLNVSVSECSAQRVQLPVRTGKGSRVGAAPSSRTQRHPQSRLSGFIVLVEVQPEAQKPKAFIGAGRQQHQKLLHDALVEVSQNPQLRAHLWDRFSEFLNPLALLLLLHRCHSPPALDFTLFPLLFKLQSSLQLPQRGSVYGVLRVLKLNDLVKHGSELV